MVEAMTSFDDQIVLSENWGSLIESDEIGVETISSVRAKISIAPLESGYGLTIGNALRRVMLSSIYGAAITMLKMDGVSHEFSVMKGVKEDVMTLILNLKEVVFKVNSPNVKKEVLHIYAIGNGPVFASAIVEKGAFSVVNKDFVICNLSGNVEFNAEITVEVNKGYIMAGKKKDIHASFDNVVLIDSVHTPVKNVSFDVQDSRVGNVTNYDRLVLDITTDGSISPELALSISAKILIKKFQSLVFFKDMSDEKVDVVNSVEKSQFMQVLHDKVDDLELSVRSFNCLQLAGIVLLGDLVTKTESELLKMPNFGRKSLNEIKNALQLKSLSLDMSVPSWVSSVS